MQFLVILIAVRLQERQINSVVLYRLVLRLLLLIPFLLVIQLLSVIILIGAKIVLIHPPTCTSPQYLDTATNTCKTNPVCVGGQTLVNHVCVDPTCPSGQHLENHSCVADAPPLPDCSSPNLCNGIIPLVPQCSAGGTPTDVSCLLPSCPDGQYYSGFKKTCVSPSPFCKKLEEFGLGNCVKDGSSHACPPPLLFFNGGNYTEDNYCIKPDAGLTGLHKTLLCAYFPFFSFCSNSEPVFLFVLIQNPFLHPLTQLI